jgi:hypothetical protein
LRKREEPMSESIDRVQRRKDAHRNNKEITPMMPPKHDDDDNDDKNNTTNVLQKNISSMMCENNAMQKNKIIAAPKRNVNTNTGASNSKKKSSGSGSVTSSDMKRSDIKSSMSICKKLSIYFIVFIILARTIGTVLQSTIGVELRINAANDVNVNVDRFKAYMSSRVVKVRVVDKATKNASGSGSGSGGYVSPPQPLSGEHIRRPNIVFFLSDDHSAEVCTHTHYTCLYVFGGFYASFHFYLPLMNIYINI